MAGFSVYSLALYGTNLFAGTINDGVFLSTNDGSTWSMVSSGITSHITSLAVLSDNLFAGSYGFGIYRRPMEEMLTPVEDLPTHASSNFKLHQNCPNPFAFSTTIAFTIPSKSFVSLKIFNALGKELTTLVSGDLDAGQHSYQWNASGLRSGVYLCRLGSGPFSETRTLILGR